ncbi:hypothetical protein SDRG_03736 [Saprolegnia diclina VS20]|uniref:RING-type domain-containing protein n=1 Tax=Saprolegnia diclina (strain VS20) TaxID=1156394 RepID=T0S7Q0_SAPDV|nr:hypothetical protein SDRG_03736 [Saprolegnia diclina VS20]EQC38777.1 hypothetical protein SDRG_03736 [Saprolegnia diclina VS20]|eukprot:XP_008607601.1 hypothetical protein SDRG_03736 [Saprolegnia diclina VS20]
MAANTARLERAQLVASELATVSTSNVARVGPAYASVTYYRMDIAFKRTPHKWTIAKRYSEFYALRRTLKSLMQRAKRQPSDKVALPLKLLEDGMAKAFPRRHFRADNAAIIAERRAALEAFVQLLVKIMCSFPPEFDRDARAGLLKDLHDMLKHFLAFPEEQLHLDAKRTLAILALEDVVVAASSDEASTTASVVSEDCCSICLGDWHDVECADMHVVKLPCNHVFHEECVLDWLNGSAECPLCRSEPR